MQKKLTKVDVADMYHETIYMKLPCNTLKHVGG